MKQYEVLKPFHLEFFRPVVEGELVTLDPNHIPLYDLADSVREVGSRERKAIADPPETEK